MRSAERSVCVCGFRPMSRIACNQWDSFAKRASPHNIGSWRSVHLVAPYCAIPRDYLSDTPLLRAMGFLVSQHGHLGAIPPPPFLSVSPLESLRSGGAIPPPQKGYLSDTCAIPYENKASGCDTPLCDTISEGYCAIWGGISHWAGKSVRAEQPFADISHHEQSVHMCVPTSLSSHWLQGGRKGG